MILSEKEIRLLLITKISSIRKELDDIKAKDGSTGFNSLEDAIEKWSIILHQDKEICEEDVSMASGFGMFAARELNDGDEPLRTLIAEFGSLATRLSGC